MNVLYVFFEFIWHLENFWDKIKISWNLVTLKSLFNSVFHFSSHGNAFNNLQITFIIAAFPVKSKYGLKILMAWG